MSTNGSPKIYLWPNLMTAGNLFCGFFAIMNIITYRIKGQEPAEVFDKALAHHYYWAIGLILLACFFDLLDGRIARMVGEESPFGKEFDSLADVVSFGVAPALLVHEIVLRELSDKAPVGWLIAFLYLCCGAMRLARFNCTAPDPQNPPSKDFQGCPIPAAAGVISSLTLLLLHFYENDKVIGNWKYALLVVMVLLSFLMFSNIPYPSFKGLSWRTKRSFPWVFSAIIVLSVTAIYPHYMLPLLFLGYLTYGLVRQRLSRRLVKEIEEDEDEPEESKPPPADAARP